MVDEHEEIVKTEIKEIKKPDINLFKSIFGDSDED